MLNNIYIGIMSGTSLDGLDICACQFKQNTDYYKYKILSARTIDYTDLNIYNDLKNSHLLNTAKLMKLNTEYAIFIADAINDFIFKEQLKNVKLISSHGHTVFHQPESGFSLQIGAGSVIAKKTNIPVVSDFRSGDIALGGQGAPLVPIGDKLLFRDFDACLNLGGFSNISYDKNSLRIAYDICPVNIVLNYFTQKNGKKYDESGEMAKSGHLIPKLFGELNSIDYYSATYPKSLSREWLESIFFKITDNYNRFAVNDILNTLVKHISYQICKEISNKKNVLITGGGAYNDFLIESIKKETCCEIIIPENQIIDFKEALIFAFLGYLRLKGENNCLASVTGAARDSCGGYIYV